MRNPNVLIALAVIAVVVLVVVGGWLVRRSARSMRVRAAADRRRTEDRTTPWESYSRPKLGTGGLRWEIGVERVTPDGRVLNREQFVEINREDPERLDWEGRAISEAAAYNESKAGMA